jgi:hypothetical protein
MRRTGPNAQIGRRTTGLLYAPGRAAPAGCRATSPTPVDALRVGNTMQESKGAALVLDFPVRG